MELVIATGRGGARLKGILVCSVIFIEQGGGRLLRRLQYTGMVSELIKIVNYRQFHVLVAGSTGRWQH